jgi:hypothetical protein
MTTTLTQKSYADTGSSITFKDSGGSAVITLQNLAYGTGRVSANYDRSTGAKPQLFEVLAVMQWEDNPVATEVAEVQYTSYTSAVTVVTGAAARPVTITAMTVPAATIPGTVTGYGYCYSDACVVEASVLVYVQQVTAGGQAIYDDAIRVLTSDANGLVSTPLWADGSTYRVKRGTRGVWSDAFTPAEDTPGGGTFLLPGFLGHE